MGIFKKKEKSKGTSKLEEPMLVVLDNKEVDELITDYKKIDKLTGTEFEEFCASLLRISGYDEVIVTPPVDDGGRDIIATKDGIQTDIEAKRWAITGTEGGTNQVGINELKKFNSSVKGERKVFITSTYYTQQAHEYAETVGIELIDRKGLMMLIAKMCPEIFGKIMYDQSIDNLKDCPKCGNKMVKKYSEKTKGYYCACLGFYERPVSCEHRENYND